LHNSSALTVWAANVKDGLRPLSLNCYIVPFGVKIEACGRQTESILVSTLLTYLDKSVMKTLFYPDKNVFQTTGPR